MIDAVKKTEAHLAQLVELVLHRKQGLALNTPATELGYGGAAGGGKSHLGRAASLIFGFDVPGLQSFLFRRQHNELVKNHMVGATSLPALVAPWVRTGFAKVVKDEVRLWNGSNLFLCHCQHEKDVFNWLGPEMYFTIIEQAEQFTPFMLQMIRGRSRVPDTLEIPEHYKLDPKWWLDPNQPEYKFPFLLYTFNPGGLAHSFFKSKFWSLPKDDDGVSEIVRQPEEEGGMLRQYIRARLEDNPSVNPKQYTRTLKGLPPKMVHAYLTGDMNVVMGSFFPELEPYRDGKNYHLIKPFKIPNHWVRLMAMDWGSCGEADPFSIGWWAVSDGVNTPYPRNSLICYRSWYGAGLPKVTATQVAEGIKSRELGEPPVISRFAGGDIDDKRGHGPSIFEIFANEGVYFLKADRRRQPGHLQFRERLIGKNEKPMIYWFEQQELELETVMNLQHDLHDPNDCTENDDHVYEQVRYMCMARPWVQDKPAKELPFEEQFRAPTINELWKIKEQENRYR